MVADTIFFSEGEIRAVRVRCGFFGRPILQIQRENFRVRLCGPNPPREPCGMRPWRDAKKKDWHDLPQFLSRQVS